MREMTISELVEFLNSEESGNCDYAVRGDSFIPKKSFRKSKYHGDDCAEFRLAGVSAIVIPAYDKAYVLKAVEQAKSYGKNVFLIKGTQRNAHPVHHDYNEVLMLNNEIVCIVKEEEINAK